MKIGRLAASGALAAVLTSSMALADPLPSWNETAAKDRIIRFVDSTTDPASEDYVTHADRIAVFDNDGTLWSEQPVYFQLIFALDRLRALAEADPSILTSDSLKAAAEGDLSKVVEGGKEALLELVDVTHSGLTVAEFQSVVADWLETARHPVTGMPYNEMTYQPMKELLSYLRDQGYKTYIVSGGGVHFMRVFAEDAYGIPAEQIIGSLGETEYVVEDGVPTIVKTPGLAYFDDKEGKPVNIDRIIGKRPIIAGGNSDGDFAMLEWVTSGDGPRFGLIVHHTDADREFAYDRDSHAGRLVDGLDKGPGLGWLIVDMAEDWARVYSSDR